MDKLSKSDIKFWVENEYPLTIIQDRYGGCYSGGWYLAFPYNFYNIDGDVAGDDMSCMWFWDHYDSIVGKGTTVQKALNDLRRKMNKELEKYG